MPHPQTRSNREHVKEESVIQSTICLQLISMPIHKPTTYPLRQCKTSTILKSCGHFHIKFSQCKTNLIFEVRTTHLLVFEIRHSVDVVQIRCGLFKSQMKIDNKTICLKPLMRGKLPCQKKYEPNDIFLMWVTTPFGHVSPFELLSMSWRYISLLPTPSYTIYIDALKVQGSYEACV